MSAGRRVAREQERQAYRRQRDGMDEAALSAAADALRRNWPEFEAWLEAHGGEVPRVPLGVAIATYLQAAEDV